MSNTNPPRKKSAKKKTAQTSTTDSTQTSAEELTPSDIAAIKAMAGLLAPSIKFHEKSPGASEDDLRMYWDVRIVKGEDERFSHTSGTSTFPDALAEKMKANAPAVFQQEIMEKIALPIVARLQSEAEKQNEERLLELAKAHADKPAAITTGGDQAMAIATGNDTAPIAEDDEEDT